MIELNEPKDFRSDNPDNVLKETDIAFENACAALNETGIADPKNLTQFEFIQRLEYYNEKNKRKNKGENG